MTAAVVRSVRFPDGSVLDGLNVAVLQRDQYVDNDTGELVVDCLVQHEVFAEPYPMRVEASRIEVIA
ncbi:hypothetical protein GCM10027289_27760 [Tsukamurella serpentis]